MKAPPLCQHLEVSTRIVDTKPPWNHPWGHRDYLVDWQPPKDVGPFGLGLIALEAQLRYDAIVEAQSANESDRRYAYAGQNVVIIYHTTVSADRPLERSVPGDHYDDHGNRSPGERISRECRWQPSARFDPHATYIEPITALWNAENCYEARLHSRYSKRLLNAYLDGGDDAVFAYLSQLWLAVFAGQYQLFCDLVASN